MVILIKLKLLAPSEGNRSWPANIEHENIANIEHENIKNIVIIECENIAIIEHENIANIML